MPNTQTVINVMVIFSINKHKTHRCSAHIIGTSIENQQLFTCVLIADIS